jgi:HD-GYP domain-containing protein (c-di-GMP phosphodiesterase class II)
MTEQAKGKYAEGSFQEAFDLLAMASSIHSGNAEAKKTIARAYADIGVREFDSRNFRNAFECFKTAVKLNPTDQLASQYFWRMKKEFDVANLKNEGAESGTKNAPAKTSAARDAEKPTGPSGTPAQETTPDRETLDKLRKTEQELQALRQSAASAKNENALLRGELELQRKSSERELQAVKETAAAQKGENAAVRAELEHQKRLMEQLRDNIAKSGRTARQENGNFADLVAAYKNLVDREREAREAEAGIIAEELKEHRKLLEERKTENTNLFIAAAGGFVFLAALVFLLFVLTARSRMRKLFDRQRAALAFSRSGIQATALGNPQLLAPHAAPGPFLLDVSPTPGSGEGMEGPGQNSLLGDLLRAERLKRMYDQVKNGSLNWDTVRDYISELDKELRADVLKVVETKLLENDLITPQAALSVLFPYLTEYDDFLREKAEYLAKRALEAEYGKQTGRFDEGELPVDADDDSPLGVKRLMEIPASLKTALKGRDGSLRTAKIVRGICRFLGFSSEDGSTAYRAALAHDAGYLLLDANRLQRVLAKNKLNEEDLRFIRSHAKKGADYFSGSKLPKAFRDVILCHHERNDGSGYPGRLSGSHIPLFAKIVGVAETFVALTSERPYRERFSPESALAIIKDLARVKFDRDHVTALTEFVLKTGAGKRG